MSTGLDARRAGARAPLSVPSRYSSTFTPLTLLTLLMLLLLGASCGSARAADAEALQPIVITATRVPTPEQQVASSITIISADDIETRQQRTITDVLKLVPGLNVVQTGGPGGVSSVFIRGTNSNHTKVLIDGIDVSDPSNATGAFDFGHLLTQDIERVEVLRGPQSGLYGSDAIGGVINIITRAGSGPMHGAIGLEGGSFDTFNQAARLAGAQDGFHYAANIEHFHAGSVPVTPLDLLAGTGVARNNDSNDNLTLSTKFGYDVTPTFDLGLVGRYTDIHLHTTGEDYPPPDFNGVPAAQQTTAATAEYFTRLTAHALTFNGLLDQTLGLAYSHSRTDTFVPNDTVPPTSSGSLNTGDRRKADWQGNFHFAPAATLVLGAEYERDGIDEPIVADVHVTSGYGELQSQLGDHWFSALNVRYDDNSRFGGKTTWRFAPAWVIQESDTKLKASVGTGFKAPTLSQLYQSFPAFDFFANPDLKPETSTGYDAGIEQGLAGGVVRFGVTWYHNHIRDLIASNDAFTQWINIGEATTQGVESFIAWQPAKELTLRIDYTYTEATDDLAHQELLRRPKHKGTFDATWQVTSAWQLNLNVLAVSDWVDVSRDGFMSGIEAPGYTSVNFATSYDLTTHLTVFGRIDNLLDRHYENPVGFLQPSIGFYAGIRVNL
jgi:vitamin B12 transporter